jgi:hypothetical protein
MSLAFMKDPVEEKFTKAVAAGALVEAENLLAQYSAYVTQRLADLRGDEREALIRHAMGRLRWAMSMVRAERARACLRLLELPSASSYGRGRSKPGIGLELEA